MFANQENIQNKSKLITRRMFILSAVKVAVFFGIISRLFYLQISENLKYRSLSDKNRLREWKVAPKRGITKREQKYMLSLNTYPQNAEEREFKERVDHYKKNIKKILVAPFNKKTWSAV